MSADESLMDGLFDDILEQPAGRPKKDVFFPWHKPRKQYVRTKQWIRIIERHFDSVVTNNEIKYLSLPGDDLLDVKELHDKICLPKDVNLNFLGFNDFNNDVDSRKEDANLTLTEVRAMPKISPASEVINYNIMNVGKYNSIPYKHVKAQGSFDVINLDFCDSVVGLSPNKFVDDHYKLLTQLCRMQSTRDEPWLLFITTRIGSEYIDPEALNILINCFNKNCQDEIFLDVMIDNFGYDLEVSQEELLSDGERFSNIVLISLLKWMQAYCLTLNPNFVVKLEDVLEYTVNHASNAPDMISIALKFTPKPNINIDPHGLAVNIHAPLNEVEIACRFPPVVTRKRNCDIELERDGVLKQQMISETEALLKKSRYDVTNFSNWCAS